CVADCTGHGVPGAMVSVVGMNALDASVTGEKISSPGKILDRLSEIVERTFSNEDTAMKDGMDIAFCRLNKQTKELTFSGANNPLYVVNKKGLTILKPNKQPIGKYDGRKSFDEESIQLSEGDAIYLFSDGYADQFGGPKGKKFMYKTLRLIIEENRNNSMKEQKEILLKAFLDWKEGYEQVDDVCIVGVRV
ncbi:MAG: serine/threonine-protein phosphatase, partial [Flavobacteriales bacterium]|nr:serine/threonine-protein phosphatase [Flavobacteriales bacterium]